MTKSPNAIPVRAEYPKRSGRPFSRAAFAAYMRAGRYGASVDLVSIVKQLYPDDRIAPLMLRTFEQRAAVDPADSSSGWAGELADYASLAFLLELAPESAAARLIARGVSFPTDNGKALLPRRQSGAIEAPWVGEGGPIPVFTDALDGVMLEPPKKVGFGVVTTREVAKRRMASEIFNTLLQESAARSLDSAYFSANAATSEGLAGLLYGATDISGSGFGGDPKQDLAGLARSVASGSGQVVFVTGSGRAAAAGIMLPELKADIFGSAAVSDDILIGIDPRSFVHGAGVLPSIDASGEGVTHMVDESPAEIVSGAPATAAPVRSLFQTDCIALRAIIEMTYVARRTGAVAFIQNMSW